MSTLPPELAKKVRQIQVVSKKAVDELLGGEYKSVFKGRGMEFDEVREYQPGDEIRTIDWNVTARTGKPFVKRFIEEREQALFFLVDMSASGTFGSTGKTKNEAAAEICALLAFSAIKNHDRVGLIIFTDEVELFISPGKGQLHVLRMISEILSFQPQKRKTDISCALDYLGKMIKRKCVTFLISDFQDADFERSLKLAAHHYDLIAVTVTDPRELNVPDAGLVELMDAETGEQVLVDTASAAARKKFNAMARAQKMELRDQLFKIGIDQIDILTERDYIHDIVRFFKSRERRQVYDVSR